MTEIQTIEMEENGETVYCAVDNHNLKKGKKFQVVYKSPNSGQLEAFMIQKGIY